MFKWHGGIFFLIFLAIMEKIPLKRIVLKIGTNVLSKENGLLDVTTISHIADQIAAAKQRGQQIILVSSGAVGAGRSVHGESDELNKIVRRQVFAAVGQIRLMNLYSQFLDNYKILCAQVLATKEDFRDRRHYLNMRNCFQALLRDNILPIVNENDVVAVDELMFTDNDELAGLIASMTGCDGLIILSNVDGVYDGPPDRESSQLIPLIEAKDKHFEEYIAPTRSAFGRGGMHTKFRIAQKAASVGIHTIIANGKRQNILNDIFTGEFIGTHFKAQNAVSPVKKWIAYNELEKKGQVFINDGAAQALCSAERVSSLLPVGITYIEGDFEKGDIIQIRKADRLIGMGIAQYDATQARSFMGQKEKKALVHYDYLFIEERG